MSDPSHETPDILQQTWQTLIAGQVAALPTETGYVLAAHLSRPSAVQRLVRMSASLSPAALPFLAVRSASDVRELLPGLAAVGLRLARRFWPGPLLIQVPEAGGLLSQRLSPELRQALCPDGTLRLRLPGSDLLVHLLPVLGGPAALLALPEPPEGTPEAEVTGSARLKALNLNPDLLVEEGPRAVRPQPTVVEVRGDTWNVVEPGVLSREVLERHLGTVIVFVCTGNTCRSPLAEVLCKKALSDRLGCPIEELPARGYHVLSAGLAASSGQRAAEEAVSVAREYGVDLSGHSSRLLTEDLASAADHLIGMTRSHLLGLDDAFPRLGSTPRLLRPDGRDIADPIGQSHAVYQECARQFWESLPPLIDEIVSEARS